MGGNMYPFFPFTLVNDVAGFPFSPVRLVVAAELRVRVAEADVAAWAVMDMMKCKQQQQSDLNSSGNPRWRPGSDFGVFHPDSQLDATLFAFVKWYIHVDLTVGALVYVNKIGWSTIAVRERPHVLRYIPAQSPTFFPLSVVADRQRTVKLGGAQYRS